MQRTSKTEICRKLTSAFEGLHMLPPAPRGVCLWEAFRKMCLESRTWLSERDKKDITADRASLPR